MAVVVCSALVLGAAAVAAADAPRLRQLVRQSQIVGIGQIAAVEELDHGRIRVLSIRVEKELKPGGDKGPYTLQAVSITDQPGAAEADPGDSGVVFLRPLNRNSYLDQHLSNPGSSYELTLRRDGWIGAAEPRQLAAVSAPVQMVIEQSRKPAETNAARQAGRRSLVFALLSGSHPLLVDDGVSSLSSIPGLSASMTDTEAGIVTSALHTTSLPIDARKKLIDEIAKLGLRKLIEPLREVSDPALQPNAWAALRKMGVPVPREDLERRLADTEPGTRLAAAREVLARKDDDSITLVSRTALKDSDPKVRLGVIEALGETQSEEAVPPLESVFVGPDVAERQASARALLNIGGDSAADALHRLAFTGPVQSQRYAVVALLSLNVGRDDPRVRDIAARHKDAKVNAMLDDHGFHPGHKH